jgi:hypothetical protein
VKRKARMSLASPPPVVGYNQKQSSSSLSKKIMTLPRIEHPSKRINDDEKSSLDIRGRSRDGHGDGKLVRNELSIPESPRRPQRSLSVRNNAKYPEHLADIPENMNTSFQQDRDKIRLPVFGKNKRKGFFLF